MERIHAGDPSALDAVLEKYWSRLVSYADRLLLDRDAAEDIVQEAMLRLWKQRSHWTPSQQLQAYLYRIIRNLSLNERMKREVRRDWAHKKRREPRAGAPSPLDLAERAELREVLDRAIEALPARRREIFILSRYHRHTYQQIAEILEIAPQTVANQMSAALDELRVRLRPQLDSFARGTLPGSPRRPPGGPD